MRISTEFPHCFLRPWEPADKNDLLRNANNRSVWRNLTESFPHPYTEGDADFWVEFANRSGANTHLAIELESTAVGGIGTIGGVGEYSKTAQFGYWLGEPYWGRGIATAAARAMVTHTLAVARFVRLEAPVFEWNPGSMRVLEKAGFIRESVRRRSVFKDGQQIDSVMYALIVDA